VVKAWPSSGSRPRVVPVWSRSPENSRDRSASSSSTERTAGARESRAFVCAEASVTYDNRLTGFNLGRRSKEGSSSSTSRETVRSSSAGAAACWNSIPRITAERFRYTAEPSSPQRRGQLQRRTNRGPERPDHNGRRVWRHGAQSHYTLRRRTCHTAIDVAREFENDEKGDAGSSNPSRDGLLVDSRKKEGIMALMDKMKAQASQLAQKGAGSRQGRTVEDGGHEG